LVRTIAMSNIWLSLRNTALVSHTILSQCFADLSFTQGDLSRHKPPLRFGLFVRGDNTSTGGGKKEKLTA